ncbi:hypothetical protein C2G38_2184928 [Gigaspora rosea]|uniref:Uncharacterized protein n=1 Tax=Gigaspora rosea TaxID=44941 RepID=A0A397V9G6_9GLOM|nr:hypothetical protein C2G38_2184928 [Gigaspora rosea]
MSIYNHLFVKQLEKVGGSPGITPLNLEGNKLQDFSQDFINEIIKCNLYNEERLKGKSILLTLDALEKFLIMKKQNPEDIIKLCLNNKVNPLIQIIIAGCYFYGKWGIGVGKDEYKAFIYDQKTAETDNSNGICAFAYCYENGIEVKKDDIKHYIYYRKIC